MSQFFVYFANKTSPFILGGYWGVGHFNYGAFQIQSETVKPSKGFESSELLLRVLV
jgi:hypothetical protein